MSDKPKGFGEGKWGEGPSSESKVKLNQILVPEPEAKAVMRHLQVIVGQLDSILDRLEGIKEKIDDERAH